VTAGFIAAVLIQLVVRGQTTLAVPYYGVGVFMPIMVMGLAIRQHILHTQTGAMRAWGARGAEFAAAMAASVFIGQIVGKWSEGGWVVLITFSLLILTAHGLLVAPIGFRDPEAIFRIVRTKARVRGAMGSIVEWQSLKMQEYRYQILVMVSRFWELFGVRRPVRYERPVEAGDYDHAVHSDHPEAPSILLPYLNQQPPPGPAPEKEPHGGQGTGASDPD
jgi:hypothetical protein